MLIFCLDLNILENHTTCLVSKNLGSFSYVSVILEVSKKNSNIENSSLTRRVAFLNLFCCFGGYGFGQSSNKTKNMTHKECRF